MRILTVADAHAYVASYAYPGAGYEAPSVATLAGTLGRAIQSCYDYIASWRGRGLCGDGEAELLEAIGVLRTEFFRLTGRAFMNAV